MSGQLPAVIEVELMKLHVGREIRKAAAVVREGALLLVNAMNPAACKLMIQRTAGIGSGVVQDG
ncbi:hypothetical protein D3C85_1552410 [compost metagenome]